MIGIIAGTGSLPLDACASLAAMGKSFFVISLFPENNKKELQIAAGQSAQIFELPFYKVSSILSFLQDQKTESVLMIGKVDKQNLLKKVQFDWLGVKLLGSLVYQNDKALMETVVELLKSRGIAVLNQDSILKGLIVPPGILCGTLTPELKQEIAYGLATAQQLSNIDVGQTVVVKDRMIIALEAIEGTDACIKRSLEIAHSGLIICKGARADHNHQYDLPTLGPETLNGLQPGQVSAIAWQSSHTLITSQSEFIRKAQALSITLVSQ